MVDFRENVLPVATSSLHLHKDDARCLNNALTVANHNKLFNIQKSSCLQEIISRTHSYLSTSKDRVTGVILLTELIQQCNTEVYQQHSPTWLRLLLQILQSHVPPSVHKATCHLLGLVLQFSKHFTDLSREIVNTTIPQLVPLLLGASSEWRGSALACMTSCLQTYPGPMVTFKTKIEKLVLNEIEEDCCPKEATECLCHLVQCGGGGNQGNKHSDSWTELSDRLIGSLQETLSALYDGLETETQSVHTDTALQLKTIDLSHQDRQPLLVHRWTVLSTCLQTLLRTEFHAVAKIPADVIIKLICRCLSINRKMLLNKPTTERTSLALQLPPIHIAALKVLKQLILTCGTLLVPWCRVVMGYISQELLWTHWPDTQGSDKPYGALRSHVYEVLTVWLKVMDGCSGLIHEEKLIIKELLHDLTPEKEVLKIDQPVTAMKMDGPPVKKKHKGGNYEVSQGISSQRKVHAMANVRLVETGLEALYWIVTTTGPELDRRCLQDIQEFVVRTLLLIQQSSVQPVPYGSSECRKGLYKVLLACALTPHPTAPPLIHCAVACLSAGLQDKNIEVSSFCREASRTCEVLIHPRVPCLNGPVVCENLIYLSDSATDHTAVQGHSAINVSDLSNTQNFNDNQAQYLNSSTLQTQGNLASVSDRMLNVKTTVESFIPELDEGGNEKETENMNKGREAITNISKDPSAGSESLPDLEDTSNKRIRNDLNDEGASMPKYAKVNAGEVSNDVKNSRNSGFVDKPIDIDESSSESAEEPKAKGTIVPFAVGSSTDLEPTAGAIGEPQPSTSKGEAIEIMSEGDSSDVEEITDDIVNSGPAVTNAQLIMIEPAIEEVKAIEERQTDNVNGIETKDDFITTDSQGNKEVLTAIPITELSSDEEESSLRELEQKSHPTSENITDKEPDPEVAAMLMTFVDADPDPE